MLARKLEQAKVYPTQFWILFWGVFITRASYSMTWPFITIYMTNKLGVSLTVATLMLTIQSIASMVGAGTISPLMDRFGRKGAMSTSLIISSLMLAAMAASNTFEWWLVFIALNGAMTPIYITGVNTMVADLVEEERRVEAYAIIRMIANVGIAIGPPIGGQLAKTSFDSIYYSAALINVIIAALSIMLITETMPANSGQNTGTQGNGYSFVFKDRIFLGFSLAYIFVEIGYTQMFMLLPPYVSDQFGLQPDQYSLLFTVNAGMVVFLQYYVTRVTLQFPVLPTIAVGVSFMPLALAAWPLAAI